MHLHGYRLHGNTERGVLYGTGAYEKGEVRNLPIFREAYEAGKEIPAVCTEVSLKVLKSRFTEAERRANLIFDGKHSTFNQVDMKYKAEDFTSGWKPFQGKSPFEED